MTVHRLVASVLVLSTLLLGRLQPAAATAPERATPHAATSSAAGTAAPASTLDAVVLGQCGTPGVPACGAPPPAVLPPPAPAPAPVAAPKPIYPRRGMMLTGWIMLGANWILASLIGAVEADICDLADNSQCRTLAKSLFIPVVGPFVAISYSNSYSEKWGLGILGASEVIGLVLGIVGTIQHVADKRAAAMQRGVALGGGWRLQVGAAAPVGPGHAPTPTLVLGTRLE